MAWGYHLVLDAYACDVKKVTDAANIAAFTKDLVETLKMKAFGEPMIVNFANHDPTKGGYTLVQLIETSNITAHFVSTTGDGYIDVFSCESYNVDDVISCIKKWFNPYTVGYRFLEREAKKGSAWQGK